MHVLRIHLAVGTPVGRPVVGVVACDVCRSVAFVVGIDAHHEAAVVSALGAELLAVRALELSSRLLLAGGMERLIALVEALIATLAVFRLRVGRVVLNS